MKRAGEAGNGKRLEREQEMLAKGRGWKRAGRLGKARGWKIIRRGWQREEAWRELEVWQTGEAGK